MDLEDKEAFDNVRASVLARVQAFVESDLSLEGMLVCFGVLTPCGFHCNSRSDFVD